MAASSNRNLNHPWKDRTTNESVSCNGYYKPFYYYVQKWLKYCKSAFYDSLALGNDFGSDVARDLGVVARLHGVAGAALRE